MPEYTDQERVYQVSGLPSDGSIVSNADVDKHIDRAERWVDRKMNTTFTAGGRTVTEIRDGTNTNTIYVDWTGREFQDANPILTLNTLTIDGTVITVSTVFVYKETGRMVLGEDSEESRFTFNEPQQIVLNYTYGLDAIPELISEITALYAAIKSLFQQMGGTFDDVTNYSIPEFSASKGEPFTNIRATTVGLINDLKGLLRDIPPLIAVG